MLCPFDVSISLSDAVYVSRLLFISLFHPFNAWWVDPYVLYIRISLDRTSRARGCPMNIGAVYVGN